MNWGIRNIRKVWESVDFQSPFTVMTIVLASYVLKVGGKLAVGAYANSTLVFGDGLHNISDIFEALLVMFAVAVSLMNLRDFPFGLKRLQYIGQVLIAASLSTMAVTVLGKGLAGTLAQFPTIDAAVRSWGWLPLPEHKPLHFGLTYLPWVLGTVAVSATVSYFVGRYQIRAGKARGHKMLVADGLETWSDCRVEVAALLGIVSEYAFGLPWLEYPFTLIVAGLMFKTAIEIGWEGIQSLLQRSLGRELEAACVTAAKAIPGIIDVGEIQTFGNGNQAVCLIKALSRRNPAYDDLRYGLTAKLTPLFLEAGQPEVLFYIRFQAPPADQHRWAVAIAKYSDIAAVSTLAGASHLRIADVVDGDPVRIHDCPISGLDRPALIELLKKKRVRQVWSWERGLDKATVQSLGSIGVTWHQAPTNAPEALGV